MISDIAQTVKKYEGQELGTILATPSLERDIALIGQSLNSANADESAQAREFLRHLLNDIDDNIQKVRLDMKANEESVNHMQRMSNACIAYMKPQGSKK